MTMMVQNLAKTRKLRGSRGPTLGFTDAVTFLNIWNDGQYKVRYVTEQNGAPSKTMDEGIVVGNVTIFNEPTIDEESATTLAAYNGLIQLIDPQSWRLMYLDADSAPKGVNDVPGFLFDFHPVGRIPGLAAYGHEFHHAFQPVCSSLKNQGLVWNTNA